jgi:hypothetical protein
VRCGRVFASSALPVVRREQQAVGAVVAQASCRVLCGSDLHAATCCVSQLGVAAASTTLPATLSFRLGADLKLARASPSEENGGGVNPDMEDIHSRLHSLFTAPRSAGQGRPAARSPRQQTVRGGAVGGGRRGLHTFRAVRREQVARPREAARPTARHRVARVRRKSTILFAA